MYLHDRLAHRFATQVIPGVASVTAASARLGTPLVRRDTPLRILPATLSEEMLTDALSDGSAYAIMKLGRNFPKVNNALRRAGIAERALYIERATMAAERIVPLHEVRAEDVPYFSLIIVPGREVATQTNAAQAPGNIRVVGLGPGAAEWLSPEAREALREATDLIGYQPYLDRVPPHALARTTRLRQSRGDRTRASRATARASGAARMRGFFRRSRHFRDGDGGNGSA